MNKFIVKKEDNQTKVYLGYVQKVGRGLKMEPNDNLLILQVS